MLQRSLLLFLVLITPFSPATAAAKGKFSPATAAVKGKPTARPGQSLRPIRDVFNPSRGNYNCGACALARVLTMSGRKLVTADDVIRRSPKLFNHEGRIQDWDQVVRNCGLKTVEKRTYVMARHCSRVEPYTEMSGKVEYSNKYAATMPTMLRHIATNLPDKATVIISARGRMAHAMNVDILGPGRAKIVDPQGMGALEKLQAKPSLAAFYRVRIMQPADAPTP